MGRLGPSTRLTFDQIERELSLTLGLLAAAHIPFFLTDQFSVTAVQEVFY